MLNCTANGMLYEKITSDDYSWTLNVADNVKDMFTDQFSLNIEREIMKDFSLSATYIYKHSANLFVNVPINTQTNEEWQYERVTYDPQLRRPRSTSTASSSRTTTGTGQLTTTDIGFLGTLNDFRVENMQSYNYIDGADPIKPQRTYQALQLVLNKRYSAGGRGSRRSSIPGRTARPNARSGRTTT